MDQLDSICPIFCQKDDGKIFQLGSGVLLEFRGHIFLLTAAHVIDRLENADLLIPHRNNEIKSIEGTYSYLKCTDKRENDFLDYGYFKLDKEFSDGLDGLFYLIKESELGIQTQYQKSEIFTFAGYPHRKSNVAGNIASTDAFAYGTYHASHSEYIKLGCEENANIVTKFNRKNSFSLKSKRIELPVLPHGISGGGVFIWPSKITTTPPKDRRLVGIGHTWKKEGFFIATRIEIFLEAILRNNPSLRD